MQRLLLVLLPVIFFSLVKFPMFIREVIGNMGRRVRESRSCLKGVVGRSKELILDKTPGNAKAPEQWLCLCRRTKEREIGESGSILVIAIGSGVLPIAIFL
ncbi:hypothetical protein TWF106_001410 [Orbilia oligospora]|uniref:Uncharacterized protein n=1 Tax=Orbilia oligospora TaxID=2813651 RepID=A0A7C8QAM7_ORBOL|nr:hypothetical protein TWF106_001410 [Orbilia oligospora]